MYTCTFFGPRDCPASIRPQLYRVIEDLVLNHNVSLFYVGHQGQFDAHVYYVLRDLACVYPEIDYAVVLAYFPVEEDYARATLPQGVEDVHPRYAITWRNNWMLRDSEFVVVYAPHSQGSAVQYAEKAKRRKKTVIYLDP